MRVSLDNGNSYLTANEVPAYVLRDLWDVLTNAMESHAIVDCTDDVAGRREFLAAYLEAADKDLVIGCLN